MPKNQSANYRPADRLGIQRVLAPQGALPQQAESIDPSLPIAEDEVLIEVQALNIDSASFHQISEQCRGDLHQIEKHILDLVRRRGKHHNPVTGSGGMLIGTVKEIGPLFDQTKTKLQVGDRIATLVSLSLTPLEIRKISKIDPKADRVEIEGHAILFSSGICAKLPTDLPDKVSLAVLDVAGAPAQTRALVKDFGPGDTVVVVGGGGKSGILCLCEAKKQKGIKTIAVEYSKEAAQRLRDLGFADHVIQADARNSTEIMEQVRALTGGKMGSLVINVANIPDTEMSCILSCKDRGVVYFFSMATSFTKAALGAEGVGADIDLRIGNGYTHGHADLALNLVRENKSLRQLFEEKYSG